MRQGDISPPDIPAGKGELKCIGTISATVASPPSTTGERLFTGHSGRLLLVSSLGWAMIQTGRLALSPMLPAIQSDLQITAFQAGLALTVIWGLYAVFQYPSGRLSDSLSRMLPLVVGLALLFVGFTALAFSPTYGVFVTSAVVVGVGAGLYPTPARALVSDLYVSRRGAAFGLHTAAGDLGGGFAAGVAVVALAVGTWRSAFIPVVLTVGVVFLLLHAWRQEPYRVGSVSLDLESTFRRVLMGRRLRWVLVAYTLYAFVWQGAAGFLPTYLQTKGFSEGMASAGFAALFLVGAGIKPVAGRLGDRFTRASVAAGALTLGAGALGWLVVAQSSLAVAVAVVAFSVGLMSYPPVIQAYLMDLFPNDSMGGDLGATRTIYLGLGSLGPTYIGFVAERASYDLAFVGLLGCLICCAVIVLGLARTE